MRKETITTEEARFKASAYCASAERCLSEVIEKLKNWGADNDTITSVVDYLIREKYVDDSRYALFYVRDKFRFNKWGRYKISMMLKAKGIPSEDISNAIGEIDENEYISTLISLLKAKKRTLKGGNDYEQKAKLYRFAISRGFENSVISVAINEMDTFGE